ncbi:MAG: BatD family protein [Planctomycetes bacterium]|nr:BatD family protein [Planctomycetota bacterium]
MRSLLLALALFRALPAGSFGQDDKTPAEEKFEPPVSGQPEGFTGAVGVFRVKASLAATTAQVGRPVLFTVRVRADQKPLARPGRPRLDTDAEIAKDFFVDTPDPAEKEIDAHTWEFYYLLKPRSTAVKEVPEVPFYFFDPAAGQDPSGYQKRFTDAIPLKVTPAPAEPVEVKGTPAKVPEVVLHLETGERLLRRDHPWELPGPVLLALFLLVPPLACGIWYVVWQRLYPDAARRARHRKSRAARQALHDLRGARGLPREQAARLADIVTLYLRYRLDLPASVPTPPEVTTHLDKVGLSAGLCRQAFTFYETCDVLRFAPSPVRDAADLADAAEELILAVESETWSSHQS